MYLPKTLLFCVTFMIVRSVPLSEFLHDFYEAPNKAILVSVQPYLYYSTIVVVDFNSPKQDLRITVFKSFVWKRCTFTSWA